MTTTAIPGPQSVVGNNPPITGPVPGVPNAPSPTIVQENPDAAPSLFWGGIGVRDIRYLAHIGAGANVGGYPNQDTGWLFNGAGVVTIDEVPNPAVSTNIAASQSTTVGGALTLAGASTGITVLANPLTILPTGNVVPAGCLVIDGVPTWVGSGQSGAFSFFNPANGLSRALVVAGASSNVTIHGYDIYGTPMTQTLAAASGTKAFKFIQRIVGNAVASGTTVGTLDVVGLPLYASSFSELKINYGDPPGPALITAGTGFTAGVTTAASATSGDTRGTYALQTSSDGTLKLTVHQTIDFGIIANSYAAVLAALIGVPQF
jgi:hypothetical protein